MKRHSKGVAMNRCHFCQRELEEVTFYIVVSGEPAEPIVTHAIWADTSVGRIGVCNLCYEQERFTGLASKDVGILHYMFGEPYSEDAENYRLSLKRLQRAFALCPCPEIEGALGYAYWKLGRTREAVRHCRSSLTQQSNHFGASKAFYVLKREDPDFRILAERVRATGHRIKSVAEEFPRQRIRKPRSSPNQREL